MFQPYRKFLVGDAGARLVAGEARQRGHRLQVDEGFRVFFVFPFTHSEEIADQQLSLALSAQLGQERVDRVRGHHDIIPRCGRFPHRNRLLGRSDTADEQAFLAGGGFAG